MKKTLFEMKALLSGRHSLQVESVFEERDNDIEDHTLRGIHGNINLTEHDL